MRLHHLLNTFFFLLITESLSAKPVIHETPAGSDSPMPTDTLYQVVIIGQSQAGGYAIWNDAITTDTETGIYTLSNGPLDSDNGPSSQLVLLTEGDVNDNNGNDPNTETSMSGLLRQAKASSKCTNCHFLGTIAYRNGIPLNGLVKGGYGYEFGWGQLHGDFIRGYQIAESSGWFWQPILVLQHGGSGGNPYGSLVNQMKDDFRMLVDSLSSGTTGFFAAVQQREKSPDYGIEMLKALDTVNHADVILSRDNAVEKTNDEIHMTNWGQRHEGVYFGHHIGRKFIAGEELSPGLRIGTHYWNGAKLVIPIENAVGTLVGSGDCDIEIYNRTDSRVESGSFSVNGTNLEFTFNTTPSGTKDIEVRADRGTGVLRDSRDNSSVSLQNSDGNPYVLYQYLLRNNYNRTIDFRGGTQTLNTFSHSVNNGGNINYYMYFPQDYDLQSSDRPILISLHGYGEFFGPVDVMLGEDGEGSIAKLANEGNHFPIMVASPRGKFLNVNGQSTLFWNPELIKQFRDYLISSYQVDPNRVYVTGYSSGAQAAWQYAVEYPQDVAALVPLAGKTNLTNISEFGINLRNEQYACQLSDIPIRGFHGQDDTLIPSYETSDMVNAINSCNPTPDPLVEMNLLPGVGHGELRTEVYADINGSANIYSWMLQYDKGGLVEDNEAPFFLPSTPVAENITDTGFDLILSLNEPGTVYYAAYADGYAPSIAQVRSGTGTGLIFSGATPNQQNSTITVGGLAALTNYEIWMFAEDDADPANSQTSLTSLIVQTANFQDNDPPIPPSAITLGSTISSIDLSWGVSHSDDIDRYNIYRLDSTWNLEGTVVSHSPFDSLPKLHYMQFEETTNDVSGNGVNSSLQNGAGYEKLNTLFGGSAVVFSGINDYINLDQGNSYIHSNFNQRTVSFWMYSNSTSGIQDIYDEGGSTNGIGIRINNGSVEGVVQNGQVIRLIGSAIQANEWMHVLLSFDQGILRLFINGDLVAENPNVPFSTVNDHSDAGGLGGTNGSNAFDVKSQNFNGLLDEFITTENIIDPALIKDYVNFYRPLNSVSAPNSTYTDTEVQLNDVYSYFVTALDTAGNESLPTPLSSGQLLEMVLPDGPQNLQAALSSDTSVFLTWESPSDTDFSSYYSIYRSTSPFDTFSASLAIEDSTANLSYQDLSLASTESYYYRVIGRNSTGEMTNLSNAANIVTPDTEAPLAPGNPQISINEGSIQVSWESSPSQDVDSYRIYSNQSAEPELSASFLSGVVDAQEQEFSDSNTTEGLIHFYLITAIDTAGNESVAVPQSVLVPNVTPPLPPDTLFAIPGVSEITLNWSESASGDVGSYTLFRIDSVWQYIDTSSDTNPVVGLDKLHYLTFESNLSDVSGNNVTSNSVNGASFGASSAFEGTFSGVFDGVNDYINLDGGNQYIHASFNERTISLWIYPQSTSGISDVYDEGGATNGISLRINNGQIEGAVQNQHVIRTIMSPIEANVWSHVALQFDRGMLKLFVNGNLVAEDLNVPYSTVNNHGNGGGLGGTNGSNAFDLKSGNFHGLIDEFVITGNVISGSTIEDYYNYYFPVTDSIFVVDTTTLAQVIAPITNFTDVNVEDSTDYSYYVTAIDTASNESNPSDPITARLVTEILVPDTPQNLTAISTGTSEVFLQWDPIATSGLRDYSVYRSTIPFSNIAQATEVANGLTQNSFTDIQLASATTYYYVVIASNILDETSDNSAVVSVTTPDYEAPGTPSDFTGSYNDPSIILQWIASVSLDVEQYRIYRDESSAPAISNDFLYQELSSSTSEFQDNMVEESFTYYYKITAVDTAGNESVSSPSISITIPDVTPPESPSNFAASLGTEEIVLQWDANTESDFGSYSIWRSNAGNQWPGDFFILVSNLQSTVFQDTQVESSSTYHYAMYATDTTGNNSPISQIVTIETPDIDAPEPPQNLTSSAQIGAIDLTWSFSSSSDVLQYQVYRGEASDPELISQNRVGSGTSTVNTFSDSGVWEGVNYHYIVTAVDDSGNESIASNVSINQPVNVLAPAPPSGLAGIVNAANQVQLTWSANSEPDLSGYVLWRSSSDFTSTDHAVALAIGIVTESYLDESTQNEYEYFYALQAVDEVNNTSVLSSTIAIQTTDIVAPETPTNLTVVNSGTSLVLGWLSNDEEDVIGYRIYGGLTSNNPLSIQSTLVAEIDSSDFPMYSFDLSVDEEGTTYYFAVSAIDDAGNESPLSAIGQGLLPNVTPPAAPTNLQLSLPDNTTVSVDWDDNSDPDLQAYRLYRSTSSLMEYNASTLIADGLETSSFVDPGLDFDTQYYYAVVAVDDAGNASDPSAVRTIQTNPEPPAGPVLLSTVKVNWTKSGVNSGLADWNDLVINVPKGYTTYDQLKDSTGGNAAYTIAVAHAQGNSNINGTTDNGTGFTNGEYPNQVMRYAGWTSSAGRFYLRNLDPDHTYSIELYSGRNYNSTGNTSFTIDNVTIDVQCYLNKADLVVFNDISPDSNNEIEVIFRENNQWSKGYLNGMIIREFEQMNQSSARRADTHEPEVPFEEITEMGLSADFALYPVPATGPITLRGYFPEENNLQLTIRDPFGCVLIERRLENAFEDLLKLGVPPGYYFFELTGRETHITRKIIISE